MATRSGGCSAKPDNLSPAPHTIGFAGCRPSFATVAGHRSLEDRQIGELSARGPTLPYAER